MEARLRSENIRSPKTYFTTNFPHIHLRTWGAPAEKKETRLLWGMVDKNERDNKVYVREAVVEAYERACEQNLDTKWGLSLILLVIVLHELSHAMTNQFFNGAITPTEEAVEDPLNQNENTQSENLNLHGESGWVVEDLVFGFNLQVEWKWDDRGDMDKIRRLIARGPDGGTRVLSVDDAKKVVLSLKESQLYKVDFQALQPAPPGATKVFRARHGGSELDSDVTRDPLPLSRETELYHSPIECGLRLRNPSGSSEATSVLSNSATITRYEVTGDDRGYTLDASGESGVKEISL